MLSDIQKQLGDHPWADKIIWLESIDSTNTYAKELAREGAAEGTVVIADHQTEGRGRLGRSFSSPAGKGIYMSVILRPKCEPEALFHLTCCAGVAAGNAVAAVTGQTPGIKWTNDLILGKRKLGGILTELSLKFGFVDYAVVIGIGINCCQTAEDFPEEIRDIATSLAITQAQRFQLMAELIRNIHLMWQNLFSEKTDYMEAFRRRCVTIGQEISVIRRDQAQQGKALDVDDNGRLLVEFSDGTRETVSSGEVSVRGMYGYV